MLNRRGVTLIELVVTMVVGGAALALVAAISLRQQRVIGDLAAGAASAAQLNDAAAILPIDLRALSSAAGDIRQALDTAIEARMTVAAAIVCDTAAGATILAPNRAGPVTYSGIVTPIQVGDTAWMLSTSDAGDSWVPHEIAATSNGRAGQCAGSAPWLDDAALLESRTQLVLTAGPLPMPGTPLRVTRSTRYSLYRAGDGAWYLGQRDWNGIARAFNATQPVAGPFLSAARSGLRFYYLDSAGAALAVPVADTRAIAVIRVDLHSQSRAPTRALTSAPGARHEDSASVWVLLRNRR